MLTVATAGPNDPNQATMPFVALKGSIVASQDGKYPEEPPTVFMMQESVYLARRQTDLNEIKAVGLPPLAKIVEMLTDHGLELIVCKPCAVGRGVDESDLRDYAKMGEAPDLAVLTQEHDQVLTF